VCGAEGDVRVIRLGGGCLRTTLALLSAAAAAALLAAWGPGPGILPALALLAGAGALAGRRSLVLDRRERLLRVLDPLPWLRRRIPLEGMGSVALEGAGGLYALWLEGPGRRVAVVSSRYETLCPREVGLEMADFLGLAFVDRRKDPGPEAGEPLSR
jgi:hypothetical protein